jgi:hypothetical protein
MHQTGIYLAAATILLSSTALASDEVNLCFFGNNQSSANIELPADDSSHYPNQWPGDPSKWNLRDPDNGFEYTYKTYKWWAFPLAGGDPVEFAAFAAGVTAYLPSPFANGERDWVRVVLGNIVGPNDDNYHYVYVAPGQFAPVEDGYDYAVGGPGEFIVLESTDTGIVPVADPTVAIGRLMGSGGTDMSTDIATTDGFLEIHTFEESIKAPHFLFDDGFDPLFRYMYERPVLASWGTISYDGEDYYAIGTAAEVRQWQLSLEELPQYQWFWSGIHIEGCLDSQGHKVPCIHSLRSIALWDAWHVSDLSTAIHYVNEMGPPPFCSRHVLTEESEWSIIVLDDWISPRTGIRYARKVRVIAPSRGIDLYLTAVHDDQEIYKAVFLFPGFWEGAVEVTGQIQGKQVYGSGYLEQWNQMP